MSSEVSTRRRCAVVLLLALGFTSLIQTGCTSPARRLGIVDELAIAYRDRVWAQRAYNLRFANCDRQYEDHFKNGFCAGYADVCNGGDGYVPAVPPETYRGYEYQCAEGSRCVDSWFDGYPEGVAAARAEDAGSYHEMHVSRMIDQAVTQAKTPDRLPSDIPVTKAKAPKIPVGTVAAKAFGAKFKPLVGSSNTELASKTTSARQAVAAASKLSPMPFAINAKVNAPVQPVRQAKLPATMTPVTPKSPAVPPIIRSSTPSSSNLPPIIKGASASWMTSAELPLPPVIRGRRIDPSTTVSSREIPLPMAVRSTFNTRTAALPTNRK